MRLPAAKELLKQRFEAGVDGIENGFELLAGFPIEHGNRFAQLFDGGAHIGDLRVERVFAGAGFGKGFDGGEVDRAQPLNFGVQSRAFGGVALGGGGVGREGGDVLGRRRCAVVLPVVQGLGERVGGVLLANLRLAACQDCALHGRLRLFLRLFGETQGVLRRLLRGVALGEFGVNQAEFVIERRERLVFLTAFGGVLVDVALPAGAAVGGFLLAPQDLVALGFVSGAGAQGFFVLMGGAVERSFGGLQALLGVARRPAQIGEGGLGVLDFCLLFDACAVCGFVRALFLRQPVRALLLLCSQAVLFVELSGAGGGLLGLRLVLLRALAILILLGKPVLRAGVFVGAQGVFCLLKCVLRIGKLLLCLLARRLSLG